MSDSVHYQTRVSFGPRLLYGSGAFVDNPLACTGMMTALGMSPTWVGLLSRKGSLLFPSR